MEKLKYTYSTEESRLKKIKIFAIEKNVPTNTIIDEAIDAYFAAKKWPKK